MNALNAIVNLPLQLLAQTTMPATPATHPGAQPGPVMQLFSTPLFPMLLAVGVLYFFMFRSKSKDTKKRQNLVDQLKKGDRVQTIGGIMGSVVEAREGDVLLKVDESTNTKIRFSRSAIHRVITEETDPKT